VTQQHEPIIVQHLPPERPAGLLAGMRIRKKLLVLHTLFSLALAAILGLALWPAVRRIVTEAEIHEARLALSVALARITDQQAQAEAGGIRFDPQPILDAVNRDLPAGVRVAGGPLADNALPDMLGPLMDPIIDDQTGTAWLAAGAPAVFKIDRRLALGYVATARLDGPRAEVTRLLIVLTLALLTSYGLIALALEVFILPKHVYSPIRTMLDADRAAREGRADKEIIPAPLIPADELGEIMRSRNRTIDSLRAKERSLAQSDRLAALGLLSAGLAHEMNTPLAVAKGLVERLTCSPDAQLSPADRALLLRVIGRLERLSESLLDYARARPPRSAPTRLAPLVDEAWTLVSLDREARHIRLQNDTPQDLLLTCDADRMLQVFVNLLRNAVDAMDSLPTSNAANPQQALIRVHAQRAEGATRITVTDNGPGLDPSVIDRLFEPFASTRLDARGTGLGLAVSEGIIKEHAGSISARNRPDQPGTEFLITLPIA
jgi:signal transduction histidine kinase